MKKTALLKLRSLPATDRMMEIAKSDKPDKDGYYTYEIYMRCQQLSGIFKVSFFLARDMRKGLRDPIYNLFINPETGEYITWDVKDSKWRTAKVDMLNWPFNPWRLSKVGKYINREGAASIKKWCDCKKGDFNGILEFQRSKLSEERERQRKKETAAWDAQLSGMPPVPKDFPDWIDRHGVTEHFIFYKYQRGGAKEGYCTYCRKKVPISPHKHNQLGTCKCCKTKVQYKALGKMAEQIWTKFEYAYLIQKFRNGSIIRRFTCRRHVEKLNICKINSLYWEERRIILDSNGKISKIFDYGNYKNKEIRWIPGYTDSTYWAMYGLYGGHVYQKTLKSVEPMLRKTGLTCIARSGLPFNPESYITVLPKIPYIEKLAKLGLTKITVGVLKNDGIAISENKDFAKALGIDKMRLKRLREANGTNVFLEWLKAEKEENTIWSDEMIRWFDKNGIRTSDLRTMKSHMSYEKIFNYLKKQSRLARLPAKELVQTYDDYFHMAERFKADLDNELIFKPKSLTKAHDQMLSLADSKEVTLQANEIQKKFPDVDQICQDITKKYTFKDKKYTIVVPQRIEDIITEGRVLGHCLDHHDIYFDRIQRRESFIVFLRKTERPDQPYYTLEIEPAGNTRQKRTTGDKQNKDFDEAKAFIRKWQRVIQKRLSKEDKELAHKSNELREKELQELREKNEKIWHGHLAGQLLADVLEADFMAVEEEMKKCS